MSGFALWPSQVATTSLLNPRAFLSLWEVLHSPVREDVKEWALGDRDGGSSWIVMGSAPEAEQWTLPAPTDHHTSRSHGGCLQGSPERRTKKQTLTSCLDALQER